MVPEGQPLRGRLLSRILIADDHSILRRHLKTLLETHAGWQVCGEATNGLEAVQQCGELKPDLIILDLAMPVKDGLQAAREISLAFPNLPILIYTNQVLSSSALEASKNRGWQIVSKADPVSVLLSALETLLARPQPGRRKPNRNTG